MLQAVVAALAAALLLVGASAFQVSIAAAAAAAARPGTALHSSLRDEATAALEAAALLRDEIAVLQKESKPVDQEEVSARSAVEAAASEAGAVPVIRQEAGSLKETLVGAKYLMSLDIGRESGTWMPPQVTTCFSISRS
jgi:high-affinity K+ transport system ATPase subunit B